MVIRSSIRSLMCMMRIGVHILPFLTNNVLTLGLLPGYPTVLTMLIFPSSPLFPRRKVEHTQNGKSTF